MRNLLFAALAALTLACSAAPAQAKYALPQPKEQVFVDAYRYKLDLEKDRLTLYYGKGVIDLPLNEFWIADRADGITPCRGDHAKRVRAYLTALSKKKRYVRMCSKMGRGDRIRFVMRRAAVQTPLRIEIVRLEGKKPFVAGVRELQKAPAEFQRASKRGCPALGLKAAQVEKLGSVRYSIALNKKLLAGWDRLQALTAKKTELKPTPPIHGPLKPGPLKKTTKPAPVERVCGLG